MKKSPKPIETEAHFKYICDICGINHWASLKEASTKNFIIVCDCGNFFKVKRIKKIKILYRTIKKKTEGINKQEEPKPQPIVSEKTIQPDLLKKSVVVLETFGFTKKEAEELLVRSYKENPIDDCLNLVKYSLSKLGETNV